LNPPSTDGKFLTYPNNSDYIFYVKLNLLYRSSDKGNSWDQVQVPLGTNDHINDLSVALNNGKLYLSAYSVFESDNIGLTWNKIYDWTTSYINIYYEIKIDPLNENYLFSIYTNTLYGSSDGGINWLYAGSNLPSSITNIYTFFAYSNKLYLFTNIGHIIGTPILTDIEKSDITLMDFSLFQNFPNPFNPTTRIKYQIPELSLVSIKVFDVLGNEIATLVNEERPTGSYEVEFNGSGLPSGVYFYKLQTDSFIEIKKMLLLK
jgi:hypothetical protein